MTLETQITREANRPLETATVRIFGRYGSEDIDAELTAAVDWNADGLATAQTDQRQAIDLPAEVLEAGLRAIEQHHNRVTA